jgi:hypothetical protein
MRKVSLGKVPFYISTFLVQITIGTFLLPLSRMLSAIYDDPNTVSKYLRSNLNLLDKTELGTLADQSR